MNRIKQTIIALAIGLSLANCGDDFLDTTSSDQMSDSNTFTTIDGAQQVLSSAAAGCATGKICSAAAENRDGCFVSRIRSKWDR